MDFKQLKIENQQLSERCDEKNHELLRLKLRAANTLQILNTYKVYTHSFKRDCNGILVMQEEAPNCAALCQL